MEACHYYEIFNTKAVYIGVGRGWLALAGHIIFFSVQGHIHAPGTTRSQSSVHCLYSAAIGMASGGYFCRPPRDSGRYGTQQPKFTYAKAVISPRPPKERFETALSSANGGEKFPIAAAVSFMIYTKYNCHTGTVLESRSQVQYVVHMA